MLRSEISRRGAERQRRGAFGRAGAPRTPQKGAPTGMKKSLIAIVAVLLVGAGMAKRAVAANNGRAQTPAAPQTGNLSKLRRDELIGKIGEIKSFLEKSSDTNAVRLLRFAAEVEREVREKKFGLVFEEHCENIDMLLEENLPVLTEVKKKFIGGDSLTQRRRDAESGGGVGHAEPVDEMVGRDDPIAPPLNFLIEGDNLAALKLLEKTHRGKIDLIYIDPPYNTGNKDFIYNDSYVDKTDTFRHSKWLSFMKKRLEIARGLMSDKGVIFISIDDNEQAALKLLCDDVFGEANFVSDVIWHSKYTTSNDAKGISRQHEHVIVFAKSITHVKFGLLARTAEMDAAYKNPDNDPKGPWKATPLHAKSGSERGKYQIEFPNGKTWEAPKGRYPRYSKERLMAIYNEGGLYFRKSGGIDRKTYLSEVKQGKTPGSVWRFDEVGSSHQANEELSDLVGKGMFDNPKPVELIIQTIIVGGASSDSTVLDFFAGSGTTGHAVMKLNAEDGGKRKFILVTNNENGICEKVTYERLKRVMEKEKYNARLKYMKIGYQDISGKLYYEYADDLLKHIRELVELENAVDFAHDKSIAIVLTQKELDALVTADARLSSCRVVYAGHDVTTTAAAKKAFAKYGIEKREIPEYYYPELEK